MVAWYVGVGSASLSALTSDRPEAPLYCRHSRRAGRVRHGGSSIGGPPGANGSARRTRNFGGAERGRLGGRSRRRLPRRGGPRSTEGTASIRASPAPLVFGVPSPVIHVQVHTPFGAGPADQDRPNTKLPNFRVPDPAGTDRWIAASLWRVSRMPRTGSGARRGSRTLGQQAHQHSLNQARGDATLARAAGPGCLAARAHPGDFANPGWQSGAPWKQAFTSYDGTWRQVRSLADRKWRTTRTTTAQYQTSHGAFGPL